VNAAEARAAEAQRAADTRLADALAAVEASAHASTRGADLAASERLLAAIRALDGAGSLTDILDTLASCAGREAQRVAVLLVRGASVNSWRMIGFKDVTSPSNLDLPLGGIGVIAEAVRTVATASSDSPGNPPFDLPAGRERIAIPIPMNGQVVAVLYADQGSGETQHDFVISWPITLDVMARHAARCLEAITAFKAARVITEQPGTIAGGASESAGSPEMSDQDQAAKRYARLLVSEIKLYHEPAVVAGRLDRDLGVRLGGEIARARAMYEQRVPAAVRSRTDYFNDELVRTLADGDRGLLETPAS
jgi:hypothetical protein